MERFRTVNFILGLAILIISTAAYGGVHQPVIALIYLLIAIGIFLFGLSSLLNGNILKICPIAIPIFLVALYGFIQTIGFGKMEVAGLGQIARTISLDPYSTELAALNFIALSAFLIFFSDSLSSKQRIKQLAFFIIFIAFIHAFFAILQSVLSPGKIYGIYEREYAEPYGVFVSRNNYAAWMILALGIPFGLLFSGAVKKDKLLLIGAIVVTGGTSILLSRSRGGLIALVFEILLILLFAIRGETKLKRNLKLASAAALIILVLIGTVFVGTESTITRLAEDSKEIQFEISRQNIWSNSLQIIKDSFPLGVGLGAFGVAYTRYDHSSGIARVEQAHNDYLQIATDAGLIGILLAALFGYLLYKEILPALKQKDAELRGISIGATGCVIGLLVHSLFDFALHTLSIAIFFLFLIAMIYRINTISITDGRS